MKPNKDVAERLKSMHFCIACGVPTVAENEEESPLVSTLTKHGNHVGANLHHISSVIVRQGT